jgi:hypothetical protein
MPKRDSGIKGFSKIEMFKEEQKGRAQLFFYEQDGFLKELIFYHS